jgi:hypothetical protein
MVVKIQPAEVPLGISYGFSLTKTNPAPPFYQELPALLCVFKKRTVNSNPALRLVYNSSKSTYQTNLVIASS